VPTKTQRAIVDLRPEQYRNYLLVLARARLRRPDALRKVSASDIVQEVLIQAHVSLTQFRGSTEAELLGWLRAILANKLADILRGLRRQKRDAGLEQSLRETVDDSSVRLAQLAANQVSPSQEVLGHERAALLAAALQELPEDQATAVILRYLSDYSIDEITVEMARTRASVCGLLRRGLEDLRQRLADHRE
jgi:RNA polymerase sigma-70 factor (ECF subfamily)